MTIHAVLFRQNIIFAQKIFSASHFGRRRNGVNLRLAAKRVATDAAFLAAAGLAAALRNIAPPPSTDARHRR
jgi:hypothetical protein